MSPPAIPLHIVKFCADWLKGTLAEPVMPPNFWGVSNP